MSAYPTEHWDNGNTGVCVTRKNAVRIFTKFFSEIIPLNILDVQKNIILTVRHHNIKSFPKFVFVACGSTIHTRCCRISSDLGSRSGTTHRPLPRHYGISVLRFRYVSYWSTMPKSSQPQSQFQIFFTFSVVFLPSLQHFGRDHKCQAWFHSDSHRHAEPHPTARRKRHAVGWHRWPRDEQPTFANAVACSIWMKHSISFAEK